MVVAEGIERFFMIFMMGGAERFELFGVAPWPATVLRRPHAYCIEDERICQVRAGRAGDRRPFIGAWPGFRISDDNRIGCS